jgi:D-alanyl-D-alanine carboxypeptidase (penicillin-binding protein 5/6)
VTLRLLAALIALAVGGAVGGPTPEEALATGRGGGSPAATGPTAKAISPKIEARSWTLIDARTGRVLESHAAAMRLPIASTTKLMTAYVAMREMPLDETVRAAPYDAIYGESLLNLRTGEEVSVRDLIYGLILRSGNDAAYDLARAASGSQKAFVREMNLHASALGLSDTHYANPIGLDEAGNYSSAADLATLTARMLRDPAFARIAAAEEARLGSLDPPRRITTINELLYLEPWVTGVKTGHTFDAGYVLVGSGMRKGVELISVVIGAPTPEARDGETLELLESGFDQYRRRVPVRRGEEIAAPSIRYAGGSLPLRAARTVVAGTHRGQRLDLVVDAPAEVEGPIERGTPLGRVTVLVDGRPAGETALRAGRTIPEANLFDRVRSFVSDHTILTAIALFVILIGAALIWRAVRRRRPWGD